MERRHALAHGRGPGALAREALDERVLGREQHEGGAVDRVDAGREDLDGVARRAGDRKPDARALGAPDPVPLHRDHFVRPVRQRVQAFQQLVRVRGDAEEPLIELTRDDGRSAAPARPVDDLLVGENRLAARAPVHVGALAVREAALQHLEEDPLIERVVLGQARGDLTAPRVTDPQPLQLPFHVGDVGQRGGLGVNAALDRGIFGRQSERVPPERVQHVEAAHPLHARHHVADQVVADVPDVRVAGRVREHLEAVELLARGIFDDLEDRVGCPARLPFLVELLRFVVGHACRQSPAGVIVLSCVRGSPLLL